MSHLKLISNKDFVSAVSLIIGLLGVITSLVTVAYTGYQTVLLRQELGNSVEQTKLTKQELENSRKVTSTQFVDTINQRLSDTKYEKIINAIEGDNAPHSSNYPLLKPRGEFDENAIDDYISNFDEISILLRDGIVDKQLAYDEFSYDAEKAWCNKDIQKYINDSRQVDNNFTGDKAFYYEFEQMAKGFLTYDKASCSKLDNE